MFKTHRLPRFFLPLLAASAATFLLSPPASAAVFSWTGAGADDNWSTGANWRGAVAPSTSSGGNELRFFGSTRLNPFVDNPWTVGGLTFAASAGDYTMSGTTLTLVASGSVTNSSTAFQTLSTSEIILLGSSTWNTANGAVEVLSTISGVGGSVTKIGASTLYFSNSNSYTGGTTITGGTLDFVAGGLGTGPIALGNAQLRWDNYFGSNTDGLAASGTITLSGTSATLNTNGNDVNLAAALAGTGNLAKTGTGTLILNGASTITSGTNIVSNGTMRLGSAPAMSAGRALVVSGTTANGSATFDLNGYDLPITSLVLGGTTTARANVVNTVSTGTGTLTLGGNVTYAWGSSTTNDPGGAVISGKLDLGAATRTFSVDDSTNASADLTVNANITGGAGAGLVKGGSGVLVLSGSNSYSGGTTINAGTLEFGAYGLGSGSLTLNNGQLRWANGNTSNLASTGSLTLLGNTSTLNTNGNDVTLATIFTGTGNLVKTGTGTLTLGVASTATSGTNTVNGGTLRLGTANALPASKALVVNGTTADGSATFDQNSYDLAISSLVLGGTTSRANVVNTVSTGSGTLTLGGDVSYTTATAAGNHLGGAVIDGKLDLGAGNHTFTIAESSRTNSELTVGANITGASSTGLIKAGAGVLVLTGTNTYSGSTTISAGALRVSSTNNLPSTTNVQLNGGVLELAGDVAINYGTGAGQVQWTSAGGFSAFGGNRTVNYNGGAAVTWGTDFAMTGQAFLLSSVNADSKVTFANAINLGGAVRTVTTSNGSAATDAELGGVLSNGGLTVTGNGRLLLSGLNTYTGVTTINGGNLAVSELANGGTNSSLGASSSSASNLVFINSELRYTGTGGSTDRLFQIGNSNTQDIGAILNSSGSGAIAFTNSGSILYGNADRRRDFTFTGTNSGDNIFRPAIGNNGTAAVRVNKEGTGKWILSGSNSYTDITYIYEGTLSVAHNNGLGTTAGGVTVLNGATLDLNNVQIGAEYLSIGGTGVGGQGALTASGTSSYAGTIQVDNSNELTIANTGLLTLSGTMRDIYASSTLTKIGTGTLALTGSNDGGRFNTEIQGGTLLLAKTATTNSFFSTRLTVYDGATLRLAGTGNDQIAFLATVQVNSGGLFDLNGRNEQFGALNGSGTVTNGAAATNSTVMVGYSEPGYFLDSTYSGVLQNGAGTLALSTSGTGTILLSGSNSYTGGTTVNLGTLTRSVAEAFVNNTAYTVNGGTLDLNNFDLTASSFRGSGGGVRLGSGNLTVNQSGVTTYSGSIFGTGSLIKQGAGTLNLSGSSSYTGGTTLGGGTLALGSAGAIGSTGTITFQGGILRYSSANTADYSGRFDTGAGQAFRIDTSGQTITLAGNLSSVGGSFEKLGLGTIILTGSNAYTGDTIVSEGAIFVMGDNSTSAETIVEDGGTLGGTGVVGNVTVQAGGTLTPGASPGLLTVEGDLTMEEGATIVMEFTGTGASAFDQIAITDLFLAGGTLYLDVSYAAAAGDSFTIFTDGVSGRGWNDGSFAIVTNLGGGLSWDTSALGSSGVISIVPEPSVCALVAIGLGILLPRKRT